MLASARSALARAAASAARLWRRSLQARVVLSTVALTALVVALLGVALLRQISDGLVGERVEVALAEAGQSSAEVQKSLSAASTDFDVEAQLSDLAARVVERGRSQGYDVVLIGPLATSPGSTGDGTGPTGGGQRFSPGLDPTSVPPALRRKVESPTGGGDGWTYTELRSGGGATGSDEPTRVPAVVVGSRLVLPADGGTYALYHLFPMGQEEQTLALVRRALLTSGLLLMLLVAGVAFLVARQVVTPVRLARRVAERIASGRLEERMQVRGEDDIARLAGSFNQMAASLQKQIRALEDMSAGQRRFVSDVSHELRTPLTTVRMAADVLHDGRHRFDPVTARSAELLHTELDRFENLLTGLLEISRFDAGAATMHLDRVDLVDVARRVVGSMSLLAEDAGVRLVLLPPDLPCVVEADALRVERVVRNLVGNAIDYARPAIVPDIEVRVAGNDTACALTVRDHGVGLAPGDETRVFNRFWRADPARARTTGGTGLGLAIAREDARLHGGWLEAWGRPGEGAQFRLTLPRRAGEDPVSSPLPLQPEPAPSRAVTR
ncbi:MtrAB system histidine kinase MtrB [Nocardioides marmoribigeumensis]|uniref:Sensor histidine kinase MtrB n=1 Tax=Nocardioides marmoribigeumensis TaxID=433649 RepID=A0ABU2C041_9ACTN|nr:MtrAB system histidine kinase MtrB [Nocardioides marmoribigeumensis]MDR7364022.1 two-component system sensor histidine kinase MtrB [Nocardioides marmoribigeumensis]